MKHSGKAVGVMGLAGDDDAISRMRGAGVVVHEYATPGTLIAACRAQVLDAIVCGLVPGAEGSAWPPPVPPPGVSPPLILRVGLSASGGGRVMRAVEGVTDARLSIRGASALDVDVCETLDGDWPSADLVIARALSRGVRDLRADIAAGVAACGSRRCNAAPLARACGMAPRTLQWHLAHVGGPTARRLLGWALTLHTVWRLETLMWPLKRAAAQAGFRSAEALSNYVLRHVGQRPMKLVARASFQEILERCVRQCVSAGVGIEPPATQGASSRAALTVA